MSNAGLDVRLVLEWLPPAGQPSVDCYAARLVKPHVNLYVLAGARSRLSVVVVTPAVHAVVFGDCARVVLSSRDLQEAPGRYVRVWFASE